MVFNRESVETLKKFKNPIPWETGTERSPRIQVNVAMQPS
jgi:hypothetical protein